MSIDISRARRLNWKGVLQMLAIKSLRRCAAKILGAQEDSACVVTVWILFFDGIGGDNL
jgi:hypothetical protein